jgi:uncharacterized protein (TIGR02145 family)
MTKLFYFLLIFFFQNFYCSSQSVKNTVCRQEQNNIIVYYNLEALSPCKISLYLSKNGGSSWEGPLKNVKGDVGNKVSSGEKSIIFSVLDEYNELRGDGIKFQVRAEIDRIEEIKTKNIGKKDWATNNLDVISYRNGDIIPEVQDKVEWSKLTTGAWCYYENKTENGIKYGKLYNWYAVNDSRGLAPLGYHIPSDAEWSKLINYLGDDHGKKLKSSSGWSDGGNGTNSSGFAGLPGGYRNDIGIYRGIGYNGYWWSSTAFDIFYAWYRFLHYNSNKDVNSLYYIKGFGFSVRCIKD